MTQDGGKVVSLTHRPPLPPENAPGTHFCWRLSRPQGHSAIGRILHQRKIPMTPSGIEPATFRFVAQHLNHCDTAVRLASKYCLYIQYLKIMINRHFFQGGKLVLQQYQKPEIIEILVSIWTGPMLIETSKTTYIPLLCSLCQRFLNEPPTFSR